MFQVHNFLDVEAQADRDVKEYTSDEQGSSVSNGNVSGLIDDTMRSPALQSRFSDYRKSSPEVLFGRLNVNQLKRKYVRSVGKKRKRKRKQELFLSSSSE